MNYQYKPMLDPLKVYMVNPLVPASQLVIVKILSGVVFGVDQLINLHLIVYSNEMRVAETLRMELESCAFSCTNSIKVSSDLLSVSDGDVCCFITDFPNPNCLKFNTEHSDEYFDALYLMTKLANSFRWFDENKTEDQRKCVRFEKSKQRHQKAAVEKERKPIFMTDGLVAMDILKSFSKNMPPEIFFSPSSITCTAKTVLGDYLNVECNVINEALVWAANDEVFHVEFEKPLIIHDKFHGSTDIIGKDLLESLNIDSTHFSAAWMKKEFIAKVASSASKNPYGCIYRAVGFSKSLRDIWLTRIQNDVGKVYANTGVISDGSLGTIKGLPYILPLEFSKDSWSVNKRFQEDTHLKMEIKRMNKAVKQHHDQLVSRCKKILQENIISQALGDEGDSVSSSKY